jgi:hypothetical protein
VTNHEPDPDIIDDGSKYLHSWDLVADGKYCEGTYTIKAVGQKGAMKDHAGKPIPGTPLAFEETYKVFVLNVTNTRSIVNMFKTKSRSQWVGRKVTFYVTILAKCMGKENHPAVRVRVPAEILKANDMSPRAKANLGRDATGCAEIKDLT